MPLPDKSQAARITAFIAILLTVIGCGISLYLLLSPSGMTQVLGILALCATNLICYPFVIAYWYVSGKPTPISVILAVQTVFVIGLLVWLAKLA